MIKTIVVPDSNKLQVDIPEEYIGKKIELLIYAVEEIEQPYEEQTKQDILEGLELAVKQANMVKQGTLKAKPIQSLLDEL